MNKHLKHHIAAITAATTLLALLATAAPARNLQQQPELQSRLD